MLRRFRSHLTYANTMATVAVFIALGGGAYATIALPRNSVGTAQLKSNAVKSAKVANGTLLARDFRASELARLRGPSGDPGATGPAGPQGATGEQGVQGIQGERGTAGTAGAAGGSGSSVVARYSLDAPITVTSTGADIPLSGPGWTQKAGEIDIVLGHALVKGPTGAGCTGGGNGAVLAGYLTSDPGGDYAGSFTIAAGQNVTYPTNIPSEDLTSTPPQHALGGPMPMLFEPAADTARQLKLFLRDKCGTADGDTANHMRVESLQLSVVRLG